MPTRGAHPWASPRRAAASPPAFAPAERAWRAAARARLPRCVHGVRAATRGGSRVVRGLWRVFGFGGVNTRLPTTPRAQRARAPGGHSWGTFSRQSTVSLDCCKVKPKARYTGGVYGVLLRGYTSVCGVLVAVIHMTRACTSNMHTHASCLLPPGTFKPSGAGPSPQGRKHVYHFSQVNST